MFCRSCGAKLHSENQMFCTACGARQIIGQAADQAANPAASQPVNPIPAPTASQPVNPIPTPTASQPVNPVPGQTAQTPVQPAAPAPAPKPVKEKKKKPDNGTGKSGNGKIIAISLIGVALIAGIIGLMFFLISYNSDEAKTARFIEQGEQCLADKEYEEAIEAFRAALEITPDSEDAYKGIIKAYKKLDDTEAMMAAYAEAAEATGNDYFSDKLAELEAENRSWDIMTAQEVREATLVDIADGLITGSGAMIVQKDTLSCVNEEPVGRGTPARGCPFVTHYDAVAGTCYVTLNGFTLTTEAGAQEYKEYDGEFVDRTADSLTWDSPQTIADPGIDSTVVTEPETLDNARDVELTMWCIATQSDSNRHSYEMAIAEMASSYPGVTLYWEAFENESYKTKIKAAVAANEMPDIFFTWSCAFLGDFVDAGRVYCLDDAYQDYMTELPETMLDNSSYDGHHYGVPLTMNYVVMYANMDILAKVGYSEVPATINDLIDCCNKLKKKGIIPFGCAGRETWCVSEYLEPIMLNTLGPDALSDIFNGRATWNNPGIEASIDTFQSMLLAGFFEMDQNKSNDDVKGGFISGRYAFYINGSWNSHEISTFANFRVGIGPFPSINPVGNCLLIGGPSDTLAVASSSRHPVVAAQYAFELGKRICHYGYIDGCGVSSWKVYGTQPSLDPLTMAINEMAMNADGFVLYGDTAMNWSDASIYLDYVSLVYLGQINGSEFTRQLASEIR
ncbi:MAG: extracellular solute-binding protein [Lachnospiraceae bacterium]|nr:extracellular solute-binding protein [Lachnospiraceae bacterium]